MFLKKKWLIVTVIFFLALVGTVIGRWTVETVNAQNGYEELRTFTEVLTLIKKSYVDEVKTKDLITGAIKGMLQSLDPHSGYMTPDAFKELQVETKGEFGGLGIQIGVKDGLITVIAPIEDTPAYRIGIKAGDKILKISGESTKNMGLTDAVSKMRGQKGTPITLLIFREGWKEPKDFTIVRDIIRIKSVKSKTLGDGIGYVRLTQFQESTANDLSSALEKLKKEGITSLILDMRNNPGGLLNSAVEVSEQFLPQKKLVVYIKGRNGEKTEYYTEGDTKYYAEIPMVVLVNQGSASASEIVAGALKDWNRAIIVGIQTFGKGSVQSLIPLADGSGLRLTTAKYYTPKGISIQGVGITPDITVKLESKNGKEHVVVREKDLDRHLKNEQQKEGPEQKETAPAEVEEKDDLQLQRAIDTLKTWKVFEKMKKAA
ncbi:MAG: peptidase S41 [Nitrospirae bacterium GWC2_46_6]|nr:MAG: peptidase S41 [Nitrospirae bacterium GWC2_46_6]OGW22364.1 MAG: peptidase S41 [Nitrospirae bacterium GWA2_46_11]OGW24067.1 MAG: peptidase S41 [Nitrospirae bacterium GWB2_47_37]HAK89069.1 peptidase S41 [Nitrospiraceae bacterium]HCL80949.1 peptidase S41 [Nitrospiraceae bacterium]